MAASNSHSVSAGGKSEVIVQTTKSNFFQGCTATAFSSAFGAGPLLAVLAALVLTGSIAAQTADNAAAGTSVLSATIVPQMIRSTGTLAGRAGETVNASFAIYAAEKGGEPLWTETQRIAISADGSYSVLLGTSTENGLPQTVFAAGHARWLGVTLQSDAELAQGSEKGAELPRTPLASVPYAMKSADAASLGGRAASDYVTREELQAASSANLASSAVTPLLSSLTGTGTANYLPVWTGAATQGNSTIYQSGANLGVNTTTPQTAFDVNGTFTARSDMRLSNEQVATASGARSSPLGEFIASSYSSTLVAAVPQSFAWQATGSGNNSAAPSSYLALLYGSGSSYLSPTQTGLSIAATGDITFAKGQGFFADPAGTATATTAYNSPFMFWESSAYSSSTSTAVPQSFAFRAVASGNDTASPTANLEFFTGTGSSAAGPEFTGLSIAPNGLITFVPGQGFPIPLATFESELNPVYASLTGASFSGAISARSAGGNTVYAENTAGGSAVAGIDYNAGTGIYGLSDSGYGVLGEVQNLAPTVHRSYAGPEIGVVGKTDPPSGNAVTVDNYYAGVWADSSDNPLVDVFASKTAAALVATTDEGNAGVFVNSSGDLPAISVQNYSGEGIYISAGTQSSFSYNGLDATAALGSGVVGSAKTAGASYAGVAGVGGLGSVVGGKQDAFSGVWGDTGVSSTTVAPLQAVGVMGTADDSPAGMFVNNSANWTTLVVTNTGTEGTSLFKTLMATSNEGTCGIGGKGDLSCTGQMKSLVSTGGGARKVETYATQSAENWMEDYGTGIMKRGVALVRIDPAFAETITTDSSYHIFLTPKGDSNGLYVINETPAGFEVRESKGGTSSLAFDYKIVAKRRGYEAQRLVDVTDRFNAEQKRALPAHKDGAARRPVARPQLHPAHSELNPEK
jgi:hypothetical protein